MPIFNTVDDTVNAKIGGSNFGFSHIKVERLKANEYTLVTIAIDISGSISGYQSQLAQMLNTIVDACRPPKNPRGDNLLLRVIVFNDYVKEVHGFLPVTSIQQYDDSDLHTGGGTALIDSLYSAIASTKTYGEDLVDQDYDVNAVTFVATDGQDNASSYTLAKVKAELEAVATEEKLDSYQTVLIGLGSNLDHYLTRVKDDGGLSQVVLLGDVTTGKLGKLAGFISKSISSSSQSLGTGAPAPAASMVF